MSDKDCGSEGAFSKLIVTAVDVAPAANSERYDFVQEDLKLREWIVGESDVTGLLDLSPSHRRSGPALAVGRVMFHISPKELENWLPRILRGTKTVNTHSVGNLESAFDVYVQRENATYKYSKMQVNSAMFRGDSRLTKEPQLIEMLLTFVGIDETEASAAWPNPEPPVPSNDVLFWLHGDSTLTFDDSPFVLPQVVDVAAWPIEAFNLVLDNGLKPKFRNSLRPICIRSESRRLLFQPRLPLSEAASNQLYFNDVNSAASLSFTSDKNLGNSDSETTFEMARLLGSKNTPSTRGRTETFLDLDLTGYFGTDPATDVLLKVTNRFPAP